MKSDVAKKHTPRTSATVEQQAVAEHPLDAPAIVDAGAGTGKTYTIINRVEYLHRNGICEAKHILLLTFARKAAAELRRRVLERLGPEVEPPLCATFHAFASSVLSQHAYDLEVSPDATVIEDVDARLEFRAAFDEVVYADDVDASAFPLRPFHRDPLRDGLFAIAQQLKERDVAVKQFLDGALAAAGEIERIPHHVIRKRAKGNKPRKPHAETTPEALAVEAADARARAHAAAEIFTRYDGRLRRRHALTYADLLLRARRGIAAHPGLVSELAGRYRHCIVDEFQDTDDAQWRFLQTLFGAELERVTAVGDPRQSIFGFRGATPQNVAGFAALPRSSAYALTENRRSRQEILDLAHALIEPATHDAAPLRAQRGAAGEQIVHLSSRWASDAEPAPNADDCRSAQARAVAQTIMALLARGRAPRDIALLSRNKTLLQPFTAALRAHGIPFRLLGGAGFYEAEEVRDAIAWLRVLANPLDGQAVARLCASPACGLSDSTTTQLVRGLDQDETAFARRVLVDPLSEQLGAEGRERIAHLRTTIDALEPYAAASLSVAFPAVLEKAGVIAGYERRGDVQAVANLRKLAELAADFQARNPQAQARDFVTYVDEIARVDFDDREADSPAADAVTIMTVHAAKGLEWPVVFVIDAWPREKPAPLIWWDMESGALLCRHGRDDTALFHVEYALKKPDADGYIPHEDDEDRGPSDEERRLFYVAITRARDELYILGGRTYRGSKREGSAHVFVRETEAWLRARDWQIDERAPATTAPLAEQTHLELSNPEAARMVAARIAQPGRRALPPLSYSTLHAFEQCPRSITYRAMLRLPDLRGERSTDLDDVLADAAAQDAQQPGALLAAGDFGRLVHRALEEWARARMRGDRLERPERYVATAAAELRVRPKGSQGRAAVEGVQAASQALRDWHIERAEAPFSLEYDGAVLTGFIDLIARDPGGRITIVDYKTGETAAAAYGLQLGIYRDAAVRVMGFDDVACAIGRFSGDTFSIEPLVVPDAAEVRARIAAVCAGLRATDLTARPGECCRGCAFRAAPCDAYPGAS
ncbi:MAG: ATP-dependent helicase [Candidatus Eremiobacteraeota bacterium]|nr:ATP-dependent helicase [Candidatus Eremiobacteraeota bacterium]